MHNDIFTQYVGNRKESRFAEKVCKKNITFVYIHTAHIHICVD